MTSITKSQRRPNATVYLLLLVDADVLEPDALAGAQVFRTPKYTSDVQEDNPASWEEPPAVPAAGNPRSRDDREPANRMMPAHRWCALTGREAPGRTLERIEATIEPAADDAPERDGHE
jgi:hypothetical protein